MTTAKYGPDNLLIQGRVPVQQDEGPHKIYRYRGPRRLMCRREKGEPYGSPFYISTFEKRLLGFRRDGVLFFFFGLLALDLWRGHTDLAFRVDVQFDHVSGLEGSGE